MAAHTQNDARHASLAKTPVQYTLERLYYNVYRQEIYDAMEPKLKMELEAKGTEDLEDEIISRVFEQKGLMKALTHDPNYTRFNVASASLQGSKLNELKNKSMLDYIAFNKVNTHTDLTTNEEKAIRGSIRPFTICYKNTFLSLTRLGIRNLELYHPQTLGSFVEGRYCCSERKILSNILELYNKEQQMHNAFQNVKLGGTLYLYTKMEPCPYCMMGLIEFINQTDTKVELFYEELIFEITRDKLHFKPKFILNLTSPTSYETLSKYDSKLANDLKNEVLLRKKFDISKRWLPIRAY